MSKPRALVTCFTLNKAFYVDHMKLCFLWYEEVIYENVNDYFKQHFVEQLLSGEQLARNEIRDLTDVIVPFDERLSKDIREAARALVFSLRGYPRWGTKDDPYANYTYPNPTNAEEYAHNVLLKKIHDEHGVVTYRDVRAEHVEGRARAAVDAVALWKIVNQEVECMLQANDDEKLAMRAIRDFSRPQIQPPLEAFQLFEVSIPSLVHTPWKEIVRIRRQGRFDSLRDKLARILQSTARDVDSAREELRMAEEAAASAIIEQYRPNVKKVVAETLWASIPNIPFFNPVAAYLHAREVQREVKKANDLNWFYLLRDIRESTQTS